MSGKPIAVFYEHPEWFKPLFAELERRNVPHERLYLREHWYDPALRDCAYLLVVNRVSAYPSGGTHPEAVLYVKQYLAYLERIGADVINGYHSYLVGASKAMQLDIFEELGLDYPGARVIHDPAQALAAAEGLVYPIIVKPNIGGSGAGILRFEGQDELALAVKVGALDLGIDHIALVQECLPAQGRCIIRVEILNGEYLYALRLPIAEDSFNYCPADGCNIDKPELAVEAYAPPANVIAAAKRVLAAAQADLGSVEYLINERDGRPYYYDINPLSNFVANALDVVGFDPFVTFVDFILDRAGF